MLHSVSALSYYSTTTESYFTTLTTSKLVVTKSDSLHRCLPATAECVSETAHAVLFPGAFMFSDHWMAACMRTILPTCVIDASNAASSMLRVRLHGGSTHSSREGQRTRSVAKVCKMDHQDGGKEEDMGLQ